MRTRNRIVSGIVVLLAGATLAQNAPLGWENLPARFEREARNGFSGVVVAIRDGQEAFAAATGEANRAEGIANRRDTVFGIGSFPIDFTQVGILMLAQEGKLSLDDPITKFFDRVPKDKRGITIEHLRTGGSGLQDFHDVPSDGNPDHAWIDREEALRRIFAQKLLFEPGTGRRHSHSAWGVLAAVLEKVSGKSYRDFTTEKIFRPLGMKDTKFYGDPVPLERMAVGYGIRSNGKVNAPPFWGKTSWLVMGSGGQVSTADDLIRFVRGVHGSDLLEPEMRDKILATWRVGPLAGGSMFGFEVICGTNPDNMVVVLSNSNPEGGDSPAVAFAEELAMLAARENAPPFSLGVGLEIDSELGVSVSRVVPGSAAERDGLLAGDVLVAVNGRALGRDPLEVLDPYLRSGEKMSFRVRRSGEEMTVAVKPNRR